ncbi:unnamed protein product, partial [Discosporangium mesarthrocarpum]
MTIAAGNTGEDGPNTLWRPSLSKNAITVGASVNSADMFDEINRQISPDYDTDVYNKDSVAYFSSIGPTVDGRLKPDILAPGHYISSARGDTS